MGKDVFFIFWFTTTPMLRSVPSLLEGGQDYYPLGQTTQHRLQTRHATFILIHKSYVFSSIYLLQDTDKLQIEIKQTHFEILHW